VILSVFELLVLSTESDPESKSGVDGTGVGSVLSIVIVSAVPWIGDMFPAGSVYLAPFKPV
jgi:hypothetical protein